MGHGSMAMIQKQKPSLWQKLEQCQGHVYNHESMVHHEHVPVKAMFTTMKMWFIMGVFLQVT